MLLWWRKKKEEIWEGSHWRFGFFSSFFFCFANMFTRLDLRAISIELFLLHSSWNRVTNTMTEIEIPNKWGKKYTFEIGQWSHQSSKCRHLPCYILFAIENDEKKRKIRIRIRHLTSEHVNSSPSSLVTKDWKDRNTYLLIYEAFFPIIIIIITIDINVFLSFCLFHVHSERQNGISSSFHTLWIRISLKMLNNQRSLQFHEKRIYKKMLFCFIVAQSDRRMVKGNVGSSAFINYWCVYKVYTVHHSFLDQIKYTYLKLFTQAWWTSFYVVEIQWFFFRLTAESMWVWNCALVRI